MGNVKTIKKGIAIALSMMLAVTVLPTGFGVPKVQAAGEMLYVGNIRVTEANAGKETICKIKRIFHYASGKKATCKVTVK